jgi:hypothetical protein
VATIAITVAAIVGINYAIRHPRIAAAISGGGTLASEKVAEKVSTEGGSSNAANAVKLNAQLTYNEASSAFTASGTLHPDAVKNSETIIAGSELANPKVIQALTEDGSSISSWAKMSTQTFKRESIVGKDG